MCYINIVQIRLYSPLEQVGVNDPGLLDSAINRPRQTISGNQLFMKKLLLCLNL
ncbi:hypothetical protein [Heyndrickxia vini]|uniref:hypothetical protein n=1 Tax=Heyndrickxia vini TaxID=1476025 RepID=UPI003CCE4F2E